MDTCPPRMPQNSNHTPCINNILQNKGKVQQRMKKIKHSNPISWLPCCWATVAVTFGFCQADGLLRGVAGNGGMRRKRQDPEGAEQVWPECQSGRVPWTHQLPDLGGWILMCPSGSHLGSPTHFRIHPRFPRTLLNTASCINQLG